MTHVDNPLDPWGATYPPTAYGVARGAGRVDAYDVLDPRARLSVPLAAVRDPDRGEVTGRSQRDAGSALHPAGLCVADVRRAAAGNQDLPGRGGRRAPILRGAVEAFAAIAALARWNAGAMAG